MELYNLTYNDQQFISTLPPDRLPEDNYSMIEIEYDKTAKVKGTYKGEEIILENLDIASYVNKLKDFKSDLEFIGDDNANKEDKNVKIFILSLCSYLIYFDFMENKSSIDLLDNEAFKHFLSLSPSNDVEKSWQKQISVFYNTFSYIFPSKWKSDIFKKDLEIYIKDYVKGYINRKLIQIDKATDDAIERINQEADEISNEMKTFRKKLLKNK